MSSWTEALGNFVKDVGDVTGASDLWHEVGATVDDGDHGFDDVRDLIGAGSRAGVNLLKAPFRALMDAGEAYSEIQDTGLDWVTGGFLAATHPNHARQAWEQRDNLSVAEAIGGTLKEFDRFTAPLSLDRGFYEDEGQGGKTRAGLPADFSVLDEDFAQMWRDSGRMNNIASGLLDAAIIVVADPLTWLAPEVKALQMGRRAPVIAADKATTRSSLGWVPSKLGHGSITPEGIEKGLSNGRWQQQMEWFAQSDDPFAIRKRITEMDVAHPDDLTNMLRMASTPDQAADIFRATALKDQAAIQRLSDQLGADYALTLDLMGHNPRPARLLALTGDDMATDEVLDSAMAAAHARYMEDPAVLKAESFQRSLNTFAKDPNPGPGMGRFLGSSARYAEKASTKAERRAQMLRSNVSGVKIFSQGRFFPKMLLIERPAGMVQVSQSNAFDDVEAFLFQVNRILRGTPHQAAVDPDKWIKRWLEASSHAAPEAARGNMLNDLHRVAFTAIAAKHGVASDDAMRFFNEGDRRTRRAVESIRNNGFLSALTDQGAPVIIKSPLLVRQTENVHLLWDMEAIDRKLANYFGSGTGLARVVGKGLGKPAQQTTGSMMDAATHYADIVNSIFKVSVLMRLGYTMRNLAEGSLSIMASGHGMSLVGSLANETLDNIEANAKRTANRFIDNFNVRTGRDVDPEVLRRAAIQSSDELDMIEKQMRDVASRIAGLDFDDIYQRDPDAAMAALRAQVQLEQADTLWHGSPDGGITSIGDIEGDLLSTTDSLNRAQRYADDTFAYIGIDGPLGTSGVDLTKATLVWVPGATSHPQAHSWPSTLPAKAADLYDRMKDRGLLTPDIEARLRRLMDSTTPNTHRTRLTSEGPSDAYAYFAQPEYKEPYNPNGTFFQERDGITYGTPNAREHWDEIGDEDGYLYHSTIAGSAIKDSGKLSIDAGGGLGGHDGKGHVSLTSDKAAAQSTVRTYRVLHRTLKPVRDAVEKIEEGRKASGGKSVRDGLAELLTQNPEDSHWGGVLNELSQYEMSLLTEALRRATNRVIDIGPGGIPIPKQPSTATTDAELHDEVTKAVERYSREAFNALRRREKKGGDADPKVFDNIARFALMDPKDFRVIKIHRDKVRGLGYLVNAKHDPAGQEYTFWGDVPIGKTAPTPQLQAKFDSQRALIQSYLDAGYDVERLAPQKGPDGDMVKESFFAPKRPDPNHPRSAALQRKANEKAKQFRVEKFDPAKQRWVRVTEPPKAWRHNSEMDVYRVKRADSKPAVAQFAVYGKTVDLTNGFVTPDDLDGLLRGRPLIKGKSMSDEDRAALVGWMRENGYGKAIVKDEDRAGGTSVLALRDFMGDEGRELAVRHRFEEAVAEAQHRAAQPPQPTPRSGATKSGRRRNRNERRAIRGRRPSGIGVGYTQPKRPAPINPDHHIDFFRMMQANGLDQTVAGLVGEYNRIGVERDNLLAQLAALQARTPGAKAKAGATPLKMTSRFGSDYTIDGAAGGAYGTLWRKLTSSDQSYIRLSQSHDATYQVSGNTLVNTLMDPKSNPRYYEGWANVLNNHFRDPEGEWIDPVVQKILDGEPMADVMRWAVETEDGAAWANSIGLPRRKGFDVRTVSNKHVDARHLEDWIIKAGQTPPTKVSSRASAERTAIDTARANAPARVGRSKGGRRVSEWDAEDVESAVAGLYSAVDMYLPDAIRGSFTSNTRITADELRTAFPDTDALPPLIGSLIPTSMEAWMAKSAGEKMAAPFLAIMRTLGPKQEDRFLRHPLFSSIYKDEMRTRLANAEALHGDRLTVEQVQAIQQQARESARVQMENILYTIVRRSELAHTMRFVAPFMSAYENVLRRWGRFAVENPAQILRMAGYTSGAVDAMKVVRVDPDTNEATEVSGLGEVDRDTYVYLPRLPGMTSNMAKGIKVPLKSVDVMFQGDVTNPGWGPLVMIPAHEITKNAPPPEEVEKYLFPYGRPEHLVDPLLAPALRKSLSLSLKDNAYMRDANSVFSYEMWRWQTGQRNDKPTMAEMQERTRGLYLLKIAANLAAPFSTQFVNERDFYAQQYRAIKSAYPDDPDKADAVFFQKYPDANLLVQSKSGNKFGGYPTRGTVKNQKKYGELLAQAAAVGDPSLGAFVSNYGQTYASTDENFSEGAYDWQYRHGPPGSASRFREVADPVETVRRANVEEGWRLFNSVVDAAEANLTAEGVTPDSSLWRETMSATRRIAKDAVYGSMRGGNEDWMRDYDQVDRGQYDRRALYFSESVLKDEQFMADHGDDPLMQYISVFLDAREQVNQLLAERDMAGGSASIDAKSNADINRVWESVLAKLRQDDTDFAQWHSRWFRNDRLVA